MSLKTIDIINIVNTKIQTLPDHIFDILSISKPKSVPEAINLSKIVSKLSPLVGNLIEFRMVEFFNEIPELKDIGTWTRQDPGLFSIPKYPLHQGLKLRLGFHWQQKLRQGLRTVKIIFLPIKLLFY